MIALQRVSGMILRVRCNRFSTSSAPAARPSTKLPSSIYGVGNRDSLTDRRGIQNFRCDNLDRLTSASQPLLGTVQGQKGSYRLEA
jgi:hypothetical protein